MKLSRITLVLITLLLFGVTSGQEVPFGINYQAVARNANGKELINATIDIRFSILVGSTVGILDYQEVHNNVQTTGYGVFSVIIGHGTPCAGLCTSFSQISWKNEPHYLQVEIKFNNEYIDMGTMPFLSVPYALYAAKSLEPGPVGPPGPQGDPASDDQVLSFDGENLSISGGNQVNLGLLLNVDDDDPDPTNEIQDLRLENDSLRLTLNPDGLKIGLADYKQDLSFNPVDNKISISNGNEIDISSLANINDQISSMNISGSELVINEGINEHRVDLSSNIIAFRAKKSLSQTGLSVVTDYDFVANNVDYNNGLGYNASTGEFTAPLAGIYTFNVGYLANGSGIARKMHIYLNGSLYETLRTDISGGNQLLLSATMKLSANDIVKVVINTGTATESGTGSFSGFKVY